jgi:hypothetical protein
VSGADGPRCAGREGEPPDGRFGAGAAEASQLVPRRLVWQGARRYFGRRKPDPDVRDNDALGAIAPSHACAANWTVAEAPGTGVLFSVAALSAGNVWAVGQDDSTGDPLIEHWNGRRWQEEPSPAVQGGGGLRSLFSLGPRDIWALGAEGDGMLVKHWNGRRWRTVPAPDPGNYANDLESISGTSPDDLWAVGYQLSQQGTGYVGSSLIEHWDGSAWSVSSSPSADVQLLSVVALTPSNAWAAGYSGQPGNQEVLEHWDGTQWTQIAGPSGNNYIINAMQQRPGRNLGWAAGEYALGGVGNAQMLRWSSSSAMFVPVRTALPSSGNSALSSVAQVSAKDAWAVGDIAPGPSSLIEHWNGSHWNIDSSGTVQGGDLTGAAITPGTVKVAWAVGVQTTTRTPLVETRCA